MENRTNKTKKILLSVFVYTSLIVTLVAVYIFNYIIPFMMDDEWYSTVLYSDEPIRNISDIVKAQIWHYNNWGGRSVAHAILQFTILMGDTFANVTNTIMLFLTGFMVELISETATGTRRTVLEKTLIITCVMGMVLGFNANWKMSLLWQAGAANYLYITFFILVFLWLYLRNIVSDTTRKAIGIEFWIIPLGLMVGWSNENMGPTAFLFSVFAIIYVKKSFGKIYAWMIEGSLASLIGSALCILAPGNFVRSAQVKEREYGLLWKLYLRCYYESKAMFEFLGLAMIVTILVVVLYRLLANEHIKKEEIFFIVMAVLSWGAMIASPHYPDRATYGTMLLLITACTIIGSRIYILNKSAGKYLVGVCVAIWLRGMFFPAEFLGVYLGWIK